MDGLTLVILFNDKHEKEISNVSDYGFIKTGECFYYVKDGVKGFLPKENILFFGDSRGWHNFHKQDSTIHDTPPTERRIDDV